jgi:copper chaperone
MRMVLAIMGVLSMLGLGPVAAEQSDKSAAGQMCLLKVSGMHCGECAKTVEKAAKTIDGVIVVKASQPKASAEITYDPEKTNPDALAKAINAKTPFKAEVARK